MARPTRTNAEYFYHPATFRNDRRVKAIRARYGAAGYGLLMMLIELLTDADNTALATDEMELELLAGDLNTDAAEVGALIQAAEKVGLFGRNEAGLLKCEQLDIWLAPVFEKRNRSKNAATAAKLPQAAAENPITVTETPPVEKSTVQESKEENNTSSSLRSEEAAPPEKKIEQGGYSSHTTSTAESPATELSTPGGAADVGTPVKSPDVRLTKRRGGKKLQAPPGSSNPADYELPDWAGPQFVAEFGGWLATRQARTDCKPLTAGAVQARLKELAGYDEQFCTGLFRAAEQNPHWQGLTFDNTPHKFTQHILALQKLQHDAARITQPERGAKPTAAASTSARAVSAQLRAIREERSAAAGGHVHLGAAAGTHAGLGSAVPPGVGSPQGG